MPLTEVQPEEIAQAEPATGSRNILLRIAYDGTDYSGWQVQPDKRTIQGTIAEAIEKVCGEPVQVTGSGRTDAGVHAIEQAANVPMASPIPCSNLVAALNRALPEDIRILSAQPVPRDFHARRSATAKTYRYRFYRPAICPPILTRFVLPYPYPLRLDDMAAASLLFAGTHDFRSLAASGSLEGTGNDEPRSSVRTIYSSELAQEGDELTYTVRGSGFLRYMVRNIVGTLIDVGRGRIAPEHVAAILSAKERSAAGPMAPARGLHLVSVEYSSDMLIAPAEA